MHDLVVLENVQDNILGIHFTREHFLSYKSFKGKCFWETSPIDNGHLKSDDRTHINALSSRKIKVRCVDKNNATIGTNNQMIATINTPHSLITGPSGIIKFDKEGIAVILLSRTVHLT
jgi:hypothetical protein